MKHSSPTRRSSDLDAWLPIGLIRSDCQLGARAVRVKGQPARPFRDRRDQLISTSGGRSASSRRVSVSFVTGVGARWNWSGVWPVKRLNRSEEHTSELQSLLRNSYAVFCLKK